MTSVILVTYKACKQRKHKAVHRHRATEWNSCCCFVLQVGEDRMTTFERKTKHFILLMRPLVIRPHSLLGNGACIAVQFRIPEGAQCTAVPSMRTVLYYQTGDASDRTTVDKTMPGSPSFQSRFDIQIMMASFVVLHNWTLMNARGKQRLQNAVFGWLFTVPIRRLALPVFP